MNKFSKVELDDMAKKLGYVGQFGFYFGDDNQELRWVLTNMHACECNKSCLHTKRVVEVYIAHVSV